MSQKTDELLRALRHYDSVEQAHDEAMEKCETSFEWGYYGSGYISALKRAEGAFTKALEEVIDERINIKISNQ